MDTHFSVDNRYFSYLNLQSNDLYVIFLVTIDSVFSKIGIFVCANERIFWQIIAKIALNHSKLKYKLKYHAKINYEQKRISQKSCREMRAKPSSFYSCYQHFHLLHSGNQKSRNLFTLRLHQIHSQQVRENKTKRKIGQEGITLSDKNKMRLSGKRSASFSISSVYIR